ncbi:DegQ family serine endoprotease [Consotaella salsifontis]|uniref:Probable periplasmic serine endoprotease DegP-like n=1 Tax=Consotaella salsifontis TaxID=1365950 RepID=A0A1T4RC64_9HYPH|nr:DegQ family serine endoprotease [Consotaella salsifontis]SKA13318.1 serine protease Do [Consotaella salsifontis]
MTGPFRRTRLIAMATVVGFSAAGAISAAAQVPGAMSPAPASPAAPALTPAPSSSMQRGPASVADVAEGLMDAVVNISTSQRVDNPNPGIAPPDAPDGSPLQDFFDDLMRDNDGSRKVQSLGSGFIIDPDGYIVTSNHVVADADEIAVNLTDGSQLDAKVVGTDEKTDLALLKVEPKKPLTALHFGDSERLRIGDWVMAIGNPFGLGGSVSVGIVSARGRNINAGPYDNFIQTDAAINRGNSGGPLFNMNGDVIGVNTAIISPSGGSIGIGFAIPSSLVANVIGQLREFGETRRGWLGIRLQEVTPEIAEGLGLDQAKGALVMGVVPGGPSDNGKFEVGDIIVSFDGKTVESSHDLPRMVAETKVGKAVEVGVIRKASRETAAEQRTVEVTLGRLEDGEKMITAKDGAGDSGASNGDATTGEVLGLSISDIDKEKRELFDLSEDLAGVVITAVDAGSTAAEKGIVPGSVIKEVAQEAVTSAEEVREKIAALRSQGRKNALMLIASNTGDLRFIVLPLE